MPTPDEPSRFTAAPDQLGEARQQGALPLATGPAREGRATGNLHITPWRCSLCVGGTAPDGGRCLHCTGTGLTDDPIGPAVRAPRPPGVRKSACGDCAYRLGSPEREALGQGLPEDEPFFCHVGLSVTAAGQYMPVATFGGLPLGAMVCAGWWSVQTGDPLSVEPFKERPYTARDVERAWSREPEIERGATPDLAQRDVTATPGALRNRLHDVRALLTLHGWSVRLTEAVEAQRLHAVHPSGAEVHASRRRRPNQSIRMRYYGLAPGTGRGWVQLKPPGFDEFVQTCTIASDTWARNAYPDCHCDKQGYAGHARAAGALEQRRAHPTPGRMPVRVYQCPDDERYWHLTSKPAFTPGGTR